MVGVEPCLLPLLSPALRAAGPGFAGSWGGTFSSPGQGVRAGLPQQTRALAVADGAHLASPQPEVGYKHTMHGMVYTQGNVS